MVPSEPADPAASGGIRRERSGGSGTEPPNKKVVKAPPASAGGVAKASAISPMASAAPLAHASPVTAVGSELAPATAAPSVSKGKEPAKPSLAPSDVAKTAATLMSGKSATDENVREALEESAQLARATASARARVASLRARGASLPELDGRLAAADLLSKRGEPEAALKILEEVLVLSNALVQSFGPEGAIDIPDPLDSRIDARLSKVFEKASEAARARTDELLSSARLAERIEEVARVRIEELLVSKRLAARIEEIASKHALDAASNAIEALLSSDNFKHSVDARARARVEEAMGAVNSGSSPEALEAAVEKAIARRDHAGSGSGKFAAFDPSLIEAQLGALVASLVKQTLSSDAAVANKMSSLVGQEVKRAQAETAVDEQQVRVLVAQEVSARMQESVLDPAERAKTVIGSDAMKAFLDEQLQLLRASLKQEVLEDLTRRAAEYRQKSQGRG